MSSKRDISKQFKHLKKQAEDFIRQKPDLVPAVPYDIVKKIEELRIYQAELEIQNEELRQAQSELSALYEEHVDLYYDDAPTAYIALSPKGLITRINLAGIKLLSIDENKAIKMTPFSLLIDQGSENVYYQTMSRLLKTGKKQSVELKLKGDERSDLWVKADIFLDSDDTGRQIQRRIVLVDITTRKQLEVALRETHDELESRVQEHTEELLKAGKALKEKTSKLEDVNTALNILLERREKDKNEIGEKILLNVKEFVLPYVEKLKKGPLTKRQESYIELLESGIDDIISPFARKLTSRYMNITPGEMQVANLVKEGKTSKEIAEILNSSERAVVAHRANLRKKLGLGRKSNLRTYLLSLQ